MGLWRGLKTSGLDQQNLSGSLQRTHNDCSSILGDIYHRLCSNKINKNINNTALVSLSALFCT